MTIEYAVGVLFIFSICYLGFAITLSMTMNRKRK